MIRRSAYSKAFIMLLKRWDAYDEFMDLLSKYQFNRIPVNTFFIKTRPSEWLMNSFDWIEHDDNVDWDVINDDWASIVYQMKKRNPPIKLEEDEML